MALDDVMASVAQWSTTTKALAALGAQLGAQQDGTEVPPEVLAALQELAEAAGWGDLREIPPPQQAMARALVTAFLHQAVDLLDHPDREPGWRFTDPAILDGWGRASMMIPVLLSNAHPDLADVTRFLDLGTGVGLLAVNATNVWPKATVVGVDCWEPSLERARANVAGAGLEDRITLRHQDLGELDDDGEFDAAWLPSWFFSEPAVRDGVPRVVAALRSGGWAAVACNTPRPTPLAGAVAAVERAREGGSDLRADDVATLLEAAGCTDVHEVPVPPPAPITLVLGRRP